MAKGLRASVNKRNKAKLRDRVFGPAEAARNERLSAKLMELVNQPKPARDTEMLAEDKNTEVEEEKEQATMSAAEEMDIDAGVTKALSGQSSKSKKGKGRVEKKRAKKERNNIAFKKTKPFKRRDKIGRA